MFQSATLKLTMMYIGILALISAFFSYSWYSVATAELDRDMSRQTMLLGNHPALRGIQVINDFVANRQEQINDSKQVILRRIIAANIALVALGGLGSFMLARRTLKPIEESHEAQARFTADASHELRTPITAMQSEIEVALRDPQLSKQGAIMLLKSNLEELKSLAHLSGGLLSLARTDQANVTALGPIDLKPVVETALRRVKKRAQLSKIKLKSIVQPATVLSEADGLEELLVILLDNAIKYSPNGSEVELKITLSKPYAEIAISDHGIGIKSSALPHIFERFYRADVSRSRQNVKGHGLGLSIAKQIAERLKTKIQVSSRSGKGSTFSIRLSVS